MTGPIGIVEACTLLKRNIDGMKAEILAKEAEIERLTSRLVALAASGDDEPLIEEVKADILGLEEALADEMAKLPAAEEAFSLTCRA